VNKEELPSDWGYSVGDLVVVAPRRTWFARSQGIGLVLDRESALFPWPIYWFKRNEVDTGWRWNKGDLVKLEISNE
jgi:hypothetical protein